MIEQAPNERESKETGYHSLYHKGELIAIIAQDHGAIIYKVERMNAEDVAKMYAE